VTYPRILFYLSEELLGLNRQALEQKLNPKRRKAKAQPQAVEATPQPPANAQK
jgi:hypothetical protein